MKKILILLIGLFLFNSNAFANLTYKQSKDISDDTDHLRGIFIKPDGTRIYVTEDTDSTQSVIEYSLTTPFDISTATNKKKTTLLIDEGGVLSVIDNPHAIEFNSDGTKMYVIRSDSATRVSIEQFTLSTPWDSSTLSWTTYKDIKTGCFTSVQARGLDFKPDGTRVFVASQGNKKVAHYDLTTPWDISTATNQTCSDFAETNVRNIQLSSDGKILYLGGNTDDDIKKYSLSTPYDVTTITLQSTTFSIASQTGEMRGFQFSSNFTKLYVTGDDGSSSGDNVIYEYDISCAGTITCSDPSSDSDVKALIEANVELSKRIIKHNTLPVFHRIEWLRRHKNKDNLSNLNAEINFTNEKISKLASGLKSLKKESKRNYNSDEWFEWSEGRVSLGKRKAINSSSKDIHSYGISIGADKIKEKDRDTMYGYVFQYGNDNIDIGGSGTKLYTDSYSLALYGTKLKDDHFFTDGIIGVSLLDIDHKRDIYGNTLKGNREGQQIFGSINFGKRLHDKKINLNPSIKLDLGYTKLKTFREKTILGNSLADALLFKEQNIKSALATIGLLLDKTDKQKERIINHHGRLEYIADLSPSSNAEFYYLNSTSTVYEYKVDNKAKHNYRIGYGIDLTSISGWSVVANFERFRANGKGHSNEIYLSVGYVPIDAMKFILDLNNSESLKTGLNINKKINGFDIEVNSDYNLISKTPDYKTNLEVKKVF